jgi:hypothetical protein
MCKIEPQTVCKLGCHGVSVDPNTRLASDLEIQGMLLAVDVATLVGGGTFGALRKFATLGRAADVSATLLPDTVFSSKALYQVTPGTRTINGLYINDKGIAQPWAAHYDAYGRLVARTDFNAGNKAAGIPATHFSQYVYGPGRQAMEINKHSSGVYKP